MATYKMLFGIILGVCLILWSLGLSFWLAFIPLWVGLIIAIAPLVMLYIYEKRGE